MRFAEFLKERQIVKSKTFPVKPMVSVIMPTYCRVHGGLLTRAIRSVLNQTLSNFEFIIVDDGSTDGTEDVIREFQRQDDRILYIHHEVNSGLPALRVDEGILLSSADYVALQTDDDEWLSPFLETVLGEAAARYKPLVHSQAEYFIEGKVHRPVFPVMQPTYLSLIQGNKIANNSTLVRKSVFREMGLYDPHVILRRWTDWDLWLRIAREIAPYMVPEVLIRVYGALPDSIGVQARQIEYEDFMSLVAQIPRNSGLRPGNIEDYDVVSLDRYGGVLAGDTISSLYRDIVYPWLTQREEQLVKLGLSLEEVTKIKQEIGSWSARAETANRRPPGRADNKGVPASKDTASIKKKLPLGIARIRRLVSGLVPPFAALMRLARVSFRFLWSIPVVYVSLRHAQDDSYDLLPPEFQTIKNDPSMSAYRKRGFMLHRSCNLQDVPFLCYKINAGGSNVSALLLAMVVDQPLARGTVSIAAVSERARVAGHTGVPVFLVDPKKPVGFFFEPPLKGGRYYITISGQNLSAPVHVLEFRKYRLIRKPFLSLVLA